jgi:predicted dehydrogenase
MVELDPRLRVPDKPTGVAIIGCGYWGANYVRVFTEMADCNVLAVCDQRVSRLKDVQRRFPAVATTTEIEKILDDDEIDAVVISTEARTHHDLATRALLAGKHLLVEKPLTTSADDATALIALARERQRLLLVGHTFIYNAGVRKVKEYVNNSLGRVYYLYARRTSLGPIRSDVNAVWDLAPHDVAIFNYLLDSTPTWVSAVGMPILGNHHEDVGFISLGYPGDIIAHIHVSWADPNKTREVVVVGSDKRILFNDLDPLERVRVFDKGVTPVVPEEPLTFGEIQFMLRDGDITSPAIAVGEPLKNQCGHFLHCIRRGELPLTDGPRGRDVVRVIEAIDESIAQRGVPVLIATAGGEEGLQLVGAAP